MSSSGAEADGGSDDPSISADGSKVVFCSSATTLVAGDTNNLLDVFLSECPAPPTVYCTAKVNSLGCLPAISSAGNPSATASNGFVVTATNILNQKAGFLLYGFGGRTALPFSGGTLCVAAPLYRTPPRLSGGSPTPLFDCSGVYRLDMNQFAAGNAGGAPHPGLSRPGTTITCQWWGRDPGFPAPDASTLTDAVEYVVGK